MTARNTPRDADAHARSRPSPLTVSDAQSPRPDDPARPAATAARPDDRQAYHYAVMRRAIDVLDAAAGQALGLEALAARLNLSPAHFQRLFSHWVGISPKRYQQYLTLDHARRLLRDRQTVLETVAETGLSGGGRLHDLFVRWEAMSPGQYARAGAGLTIRHGRFDSPFGPILAMGTERGLCGLAFTSEAGADAAFADLAGRWPAARFARDPAAIAPSVEAAFAPGRAAPLHVLGGPFPDQGLGGVAGHPRGTGRDLLGHRRGNRSSRRRARGRRRGRPQPGRLPHPVPPGHPQVGRAGRLPLGPAGQARHAGVGGRPERRQGLTGNRAARRGTAFANAVPTRFANRVRPASAGSRQRHLARPAGAFRRGACS